MKSKDKVAALHPEWNIFQLCRFLTNEFFKRTGQCTPIVLNELIHYRPLPLYTSNVRCLNGSAHVRTTSNVNEITCPLCDNVMTASKFWSKQRKEFYAKERTKVEQKIYKGLF